MNGSSDRMPGYGGVGRAFRERSERESAEARARGAEAQRRFRELQRKRAEAIKAEEGLKREKERLEREIGEITAKMEALVEEWGMDEDNRGDLSEN